MGLKHMRRVIVWLCVLVIALPLCFSLSIDPQVEQQLEHNSTVKIKVILKERPVLARQQVRIESADEPRTLAKRHNVAVRRRFSSLPAFSAEVDSSQLQDLIDDPSVERIEYVYPMHTTLSEATQLTNVPNVWPMQRLGVNLTGAGEVICVLDTGVNYHHGIFGNCTLAELQGGSCERIVAGFDFGNDDVDPIDVNSDSHGTNVAGIVISNDTTYRGMAPEAKIVVLKVFADNGSGDSDDLDAAIEWCVANASRFNISVITMSLGFTGSWSNSSCDDVSTTTTAAITRAIQNNISVISASGNDATWGVIAPGCIQNVTSVGATYDADIGGVGFGVCSDSTTGTDNITCFSNRGPNLYLLAPGSSMTSANKAGTFGALSGTSQATPMVAGATAILRGFIRLQNGTQADPRLFQRALNQSGERLNDTTKTNLIFSRIDVLRAIRYLDSSPPQVSIAFPSNGSYTRSGNFSVNYTLNDPNLLANASLFANFSGVFVMNMSNTTTLTNSNLTSFIVQNLSDGNYLINVIGCDNTSKCGFAPQNISFTVDSVGTLVTLLSPASSHLINSSPLVFSYNVTDASPSIACNLTINGRVNQSNESVSPSGAVQQFSIIADFDGQLTWNVNCTDLAQNTGNGTPQTFWYDGKAPNVTLELPQNSTFTRAQYVLFNYSSSDFSGLKNSTLYANFSGVFEANVSNQTLLISGDSYQLNVSAVPDGQYVWNVLVCDNVTAAHCGFAASNFTVTLDTTVPTIFFNVPQTRANGTVTRNSTGIIEVSINDSEIGNCTFAWFNATDGALYHNYTSPGFQGTSSVTSEAVTLPDGIYLFNVSTIDLTGNAAATPTYELTVDTVLPLPLVAPRTIGTNMTDSVVMINMTWKDSPGPSGGLSGYLLSVNQGSGFVNGSWAVFVSSNNISTANFTVNVTAGTNVSYKFFANDSAGNFNVSLAGSFLIPNSPPSQAQVLSPQNNSVNSSIIFSANASDADNQSLTFYYFLNGTFHSSSASNVTYTGSDGTYLLEVMASDGNSNATSNSSAIIFTKDSTSPNVTYSLGTPSDNSFSNTADWISVNVSIADATFMRAEFLLMNQSAIVNQTNITNGNRTVNFTDLALAATYRFNVTVYDRAGNVNFTATRNVTFDNHTPNISSVSSGSPTSSTAAISWVSDEGVNASVQYGPTQSLGTQVIAAGFVPSQSVSISSLSASTLYYYNITACDAAGNCNSTGTFSFTTAAASSGGSSSGGGGGGGGGGSAAPSAPSNVQTQITYFSAGETKDIEPTISGFEVSKISVTSSVAGSASFTFEKLLAKPSGTPAITRSVDSFFSIGKSLPDASIRNVDIFFSVNKSWLVANGLDAASVRLERFTTLWTPLPTFIVNESGSRMRFRAQSPGLSYFAITAQPKQSVPPPAAVAPPPAPVGAAVAEIKDDVAAPPPPAAAPRRNSPIIKVGIVALLIVGAAGALLAARRRAPVHIAPSSNQRIERVEAYASKRLAMGHSQKEIKEALVIVGWPEPMVNKVLLKLTLSRVDGRFDELKIPSMKVGMSEKVAYVRKQLAAGSARASIEAKVRAAGWRPEEISAVFEKVRL